MGAGWLAETEEHCELVESRLRGCWGVLWVASTHREGVLHCARCQGRCAAWGERLSLPLRTRRGQGLGQMGFVTSTHASGFPSKRAAGGGAETVATRKDGGGASLVRGGTSEKGAGTDQWMAEDEGWGSSFRWGLGDLVGPVGKVWDLQGWRPRK